MTFSLNEIHAYEALDKAIGGLDINVMDVHESSAEKYADTARNYASNALWYFKAAELAASPDLKAKQEVIINERLLVERERARAQAIEKRESHVLSLLSGLVPKANKVGVSYMETNADMFYFRITKDGQVLVEIDYDRESYTVVAEINGNDLSPEDWSTLNGSSSPVNQSRIYALVVEYLADKSASA